MKPTKASSTDPLHRTPVDRYARLFTDMEQTGIYLVRPTDEADAIAGANAAESLVIEVDLAHLRDKDALLDAIAKQLRFPEWFGGGWDALSDCLTDMAWLPATGYVIVLKQCASIHSRAPRDFTMLLDILQETIDIWRDADTTFWCLVERENDRFADDFAWMPLISVPA
jgi:RNAse (barnase) inhibitor barstar